MQFDHLQNNQVPAETCILCNSNNIVHLETIRTADLIGLYKTRANVNVKRLFENKPRINFYSCGHCQLKFFLPQVIGDGAFYDELQNYAGYYLTDKSEFYEAAKWIDSMDDVLEIGCGTGNFTNFIKYRSFTGLEFSEKSIQIARNKGLNVLSESLEHHAEHYKNKYDAVCYFQVLEHVSEPYQFIKDSISCLKPGGKLIIAVPSDDSFIKGAVNAYLNMPPHHASRWPDETIKKISLLFKVNFIKLHHEPLHKIHRQFYAKTKIYQFLNRLFRIKYRIVDCRKKNRFLYMVAVLLAYLLTPILTRNKSINGQSMVAIFEKS